MNKKALYNLSYGVFMLSTVADGRANGCITNTGIQVAGNPARIAISVLNSNLTCDMIKKSGVFALSLLDNTCTFDTIKHFGMQSGRDVDKMGVLTLPKDCNGIPYMSWAACAVISGRVVNSMDLGTHTLFIAEIVDMEVLSANPPLTYADYQNRVKPKPQTKKEDKKIVGFKCRICGYVYEGSELPKDFTCPLCGHGPEDFEPIYES